MAMQLLPPLSRDPKWPGARHPPVGTSLICATSTTHGGTRDGVLMQTIQLGGLLFETADSEELNYRAELRDAMLRAIGSFALRHLSSRIRRRADVALQAIPERSRPSRCALAATAGAAKNVRERAFRDAAASAASGPLGWADRLARRGVSQPRKAALAAEKHALDTAREALVAALSHYAPRLL